MMLIPSPSSLPEETRNRVGMTMNGDDYSFVYDTTAGIPAVIEEVTPDGSVFYIREPGGELLARVDEDENIRYYRFDELGSTRMLTDGTGTVTDRYVYDAWSNTLSHTGSTDQPYQYVGRLGYYTHHQDPEFALMQLGVRFYDAQVGRFGQRDPLRDGANWYVYVSDNPVTTIDPTGLYGVGGNNGNWRENINSFIDVGCNIRAAQCLQGAGQQAMDETVAAYGGMNDMEESNAVLHCTMTCKMAMHCGRQNAVDVSNNHEKYNWSPENGSMDLWNNGQGLDCADNGIYGRGSCLACCRVKAARNELRWLLPRPNAPLIIHPEYPGGNQ